MLNKSAATDEISSLFHEQVMYKTTVENGERKSLLFGGFIVKWNKVHLEKNEQRWKSMPDSLEKQKQQEKK